MRRRWRAGDAGFTMTELMIVVVLIGVLAAIALPFFLRQREAAYDASVKDDLRRVWVAAQAARTETGHASDVAAEQIKADDPVSPGNTIAVHVVLDDFCLVGSHGDRTWVRDGDGLRAGAASDCGGSVLLSLP